MSSDPRTQTLTMEFLFLFHACKLTNNRPDQSVSVADVARSAALNQDQSEQICASLREARLIRYSSLLGDISVTRFGVSEVVTTKACPNSGANYFPAVKQMGLRFSRGHHLFDELELSRLTSNRYDRQTEVFAENSGRPDTAGLTKVSWQVDQNKTASQVRQEIIRELEHLLIQLDDHSNNSAPKQTPPQRPTRRPTRRPLQCPPAVQQPTRALAKPAGPRQKENSSLSAPSLLMNTKWKSGTKVYADNRILKDEPSAGTKGKSGFRPGNSMHTMKPGTYQPELAGSVEKLHELFQGWCRTSSCKKTLTQYTDSFLSDLEHINESLFSFT